MSCCNSYTLQLNSRQLLYTLYRFITRCSSFFAAVFSYTPLLILLLLPTRHTPLSPASSPLPSPPSLLPPHAIPSGLVTHTHIMIRWRTTKSRSRATRANPGSVLQQTSEFLIPPPTHTSCEPGANLPPDFYGTSAYLFFPPLPLSRHHQCSAHLESSGRGGPGATVASSTQHQPTNPPTGHMKIRRHRSGHAREACETGVGVGKRTDDDGDSNSDNHDGRLSLPPSGPCPLPSSCRPWLGTHPHNHPPFHFLRLPHLPWCHLHYRETRTIAYLYWGVFPSLHPPLTAPSRYDVAPLSRGGIEAKATNRTAYA
ncbi:hypothetical protein GGS23DRAFT_241193 [Durotheca rogersii]|uniref:uncharacterized protein n=1 Tax=Durotheca rogersii TaxID=419775 RepID=UPI00221FDA3D|nr:uncharacterized protein GGS23DRAFT_241193 [Durotheca rogersii]KAI5860249.1 hypothetical protein GGS23DRAFT_241193 [Durotheca rogersii]